MSIVYVTTREGEAKTIPGQEGLSLMEILRDNGIDEAFALCGGCCSCATCHVYVEGEGLSALPPASADESDLLDGLGHRRDNSRLSCQIAWTPGLGSLQVAIAPAD